MVLVTKSKYLTGLSGDARVESQLFRANKGPHCIEEFTEAPEDIPSVQWSDIMMVSTPSPYTHEEIKVSK